MFGYQKFFFLALTLSAACPQLLAGENLLRNGDLDLWSNGKLQGWEVGDGVAATEDVITRASGTASLRTYAERDQESAFPYTSITQKVTLEPNTTYLLSFWSAKDGTGDVRAYVSANDGTEPLLAYISGWANFYPWHKVSETFSTRAGKNYTIKLIHYGKIRSLAWFDDVVLKRVDEPTRSAKKSNKDVDLFTQSYMVPFNSSTLDETIQFTDRIGIQITRDEYEPCLVGIRSQRNMSDVILRLKDDLRSASGETLPRDRFTIRSCEQGVLPLSQPRDIAKGQNLGWWITVKSDPSLAPGQYVGTFQIVSGERVLTEAELVVDLIDVTLPKTKMSFSLWHALYYFRPEHITAELVKAYYEDMVAHGMTTAIIYASANVDGKQTDLSKNHMLSAEKEKWSEFCKWGLDQLVPVILDSGLCAEGQPLVLLSGKQEGPGTEKSYSKEIVGGLLDAWEDRQWPQLLLYVSDEPSTRERIDAVKPILQEIKSWDRPVATVTAGLDVPELGDLYDVWIQAESEINVETVLAAKDHGAELWTYNCTMPFRNAPFNRSLYGFWAYRAEVGGVMRWAYYDARTFYYDEKGTLQGNVGQSLSQIVPSSNGPVPTVAWEATREGTEDYRLMSLFDDTVERAKSRSAALQEKIKSLLSKDDLEMLAKIDKQKQTKYKEGEATIDWKPVTPEQIKGAELFEIAARLELAIEMAHNARVELIESIAVGAMGGRAKIPFMTAYEEFYPSIGLGDQRTFAEVLRRSILGYLLRVQHEIDASA